MRLNSAKACPDWRVANAELSLQRSASTPVSAAVGGCEGMAVGTQQPQILEPVVAMVAIAMVQFQGNRPTQPGREFAFRAHRLKQLAFQQVTLESGGEDLGVLDQVLLDRFPSRSELPALREFAGKVGSVQLVMPDGFVKNVVIAAGSLDVEFLQHLPDRVRAFNRASQRQQGVFAELHDAREESVET